MTEPILEWRISNEMPRVEESGAVFDDGTVWLWIGVGAGSARRDVAGVFRLDGADVARASELAATIVPDADPLPPGHLGLSVTAGAESVVVDIASPGALWKATLAEHVSSLADAAANEPLAAVRVEAVVTRFPPELKMASRLAYRLVGLGSQPSRVRVDLAQLWAHWLTASGDVLGRVALDDPGMGFVDDEARLVDGVHSVAVIEPDQIVALAAVLPEPPAGASAVTARLTGTFTRIDPGGAAAEPTEHFQITSRPVEN